jgi:hypothetical protein
MAVRPVNPKDKYICSCGRYSGSSASKFYDHVRNMKKYHPDEYHELTGKAPGMVDNPVIPEPRPLELQPAVKLVERAPEIDVIAEMNLEQRACIERHETPDDYAFFWSDESGSILAGVMEQTADAVEELVAARVAEIDNNEPLENEPSEKTKKYRRYLTWELIIWGVALLMILIGVGSYLMMIS